MVYYTDVLELLLGGVEKKTFASPRGSSTPARNHLVNRSVNLPMN